jgi:outer membrane protein insertion porin family
MYFTIIMPRLSMTFPRIGACLAYMLCCVMLPLRTEAQPRVTVSFEGLSSLSPNHLETELRRTGALRPDNSGIQSALRGIEAVARSNGLYFTRASLDTLQWQTDSAAVTLRFLVDEGPLLRVCSIEINGNVAVSRQDILAAWDTRPGQPFLEQLLGADIERLLDVYDKRGHPFAAIRVAAIDVRMQQDEACADIVIDIDEGDPFVISEFTVEGNHLTRSYVIIRETRLIPGSRFDPDKINDIRRRLERLRFFSSVSEPMLYVRNGVGGLLLRVAEGNTNLFDGIIGYQPPRVDGEAGYVTGLVNVSFRNIFGTGRRMDARWERATESISELEIRYLEPWFLSLPLNLHGGLFQRQQDSLYVHRTLDVSVSFLASSDLQITARGLRSDVIPSEFSLSPTLTASTTWSGGLELLIDTRNDVYNPSAGIQLRNSWDGGSKSRRIAVTGEQSSSFVQRFELDAAVFRTVVSRVVAAVSLHGRELRGAALDISDLYRLGGATTLRGYREEQFIGTRMGWMNAELRYTLGRRSFAFTFFDFGHIFQSEDTEQGRDALSLSRNGYGLGLRLETGLGVMSVSYALGRGDGLGDGKIHFGLINEF